MKILPTIPTIQDFSLSSLPTNFLRALSSISQASSRQKRVIVDPEIHKEVNELNVRELTLEDCMRSYFRREVMDFRSEYTCEHCHRVVEVMRDSNMEHPPFVLILHLMRFAFDNFKSIKLTETIHYPIQVILILNNISGTRLF